MDDESCRRSRAHLVEDVILTLGNIRAALGWIRGDDVPEAMRGIALDRIEREIGALEDRAAALRPDGNDVVLVLRNPLPRPAEGATAPGSDPERAPRRVRRLGQEARIAARAGRGG